MKYVLIDMDNVVVRMDPDDPALAATVAAYYKYHFLHNPRVRAGKQNVSLLTYRKAKWLVWHNEAKTQITVKRHKDRAG